MPPRSSTAGCRHWRPRSARSCCSSARALLAAVADDGLQRLHTQAARKIGEKRRQVAEQVLELRSLRGKSSGRLDAMLLRVTTEAAEFELCHARLRALRTVHARMLAETTQCLSGDFLQEEVSRMQQALRTSLLGLGARKAFGTMCRRVTASMVRAQKHMDELQAMLGASFAQLNAEFGFGLALAPPPHLDARLRELQAIENGYAQFFGLRQAFRLADFAFSAPFRRLLIGKLQAVFENASADIRSWNRAASMQLDTQLRERRGSFRQRRETLQRVQSVDGELEQRIGEIEAQEARLQQLQQRVAEQVDSVRRALQTDPPQLRMAAPALADQAPA